MALKKILRGIPLLLFALYLGCYKPMDLEKRPIPPNTLVLEFAKPVKFVIELYIDGKRVPIRFSEKSRQLWVEGLQPGTHSFNVQSISYIFGPEFDSFQVNDKTGAHFFIQSRGYRSSLPKNRAQIAIRAYRKKLKKEGVNVKSPDPGTVHATFK